MRCFNPLSMQGHPPPCWVQPAIHQKTQVARCSIPHFDLQFRHGNTSYTLPYIVMGASDMKEQELRGSTSTEGKGTSHGHLHLAEALGEHCQQQVPWVQLWGCWWWQLDSSMAGGGILMGSFHKTISILSLAIQIPHLCLWSSQRFWEPSNQEFFCS